MKFEEYWEKLVYKNFALKNEEVKIRTKKLKDIARQAYDYGAAHKKSEDLFNDLFGNLKR